MVTKENVLRLLCSLIDLRIRVIKNSVLYTDCGICSNVDAIGGDKSLLYMFYYKCPSFSGNMSCPVPPGAGGYHLFAHDKWVGNYGKARIKFLDELIMVIEMKIARGEYAY